MAVTSKVLLAWPNYILPQIRTGATGALPPTDTPTFSGGSWTRSPSLFTAGELSNGARSTSASTANAQFDVNLVAVRTIGAVALVRHNMTTFAGDAKVRIRLANVSNFAVLLYDSGWVNAYQAVPPSGPAMYGEQWAPYRSRVFLHALTTQTAAQYLRVEIDDTTNDAGYIDIGGLFAGPAWQPTVNVEFGAGLGWRDKSQIDEMESGVRFVNRQPKGRSATLTFSELSVDETMGFPWELMARVGITDDVLFSFDPTTAYHLARWSFLCSLEALNEIEFPFWNSGKVGVRLIEKL